MSRVIFFGCHKHQNWYAKLTLLIVSTNFFHEILADCLPQSLFLTPVRNAVDAVLLVLVEIGDEPLATNLFHIKPVLFDVFLWAEGTILPLLTYIEDSNSMRLVLLFDSIYLENCNCATIACHKVVKPFVVHSLMFRQVEHCVENGIEVTCHILFRLLQKLMVRDILAKLESNAVQVLVCFVARQQATNKRQQTN